MQTELWCSLQCAAYMQPEEGAKLRHPLAETMPLCRSYLSFLIYSGTFGADKWLDWFTLSFYIYVDPPQKTVRGTWLWGWGTAFLEASCATSSAEMSLGSRRGHEPMCGPAETRAIAPVTLVSFSMTCATTDSVTSQRHRHTNVLRHRLSLAFQRGEMKSSQEFAFGWDSWMKYISWLKIHANSLLPEIRLKQIQPNHLGLLNQVESWLGLALVSDGD